MRIEHKNIVVKDIQNSEKVFIDMLGFEKTCQLELDTLWIEELTGFSSSKAKCVFLEPRSKNCRIELLEYINPKTFSSSTPLYYQLNIQGMGHIALEVEDIYSIYQKVQEYGVEFISKPVIVPLEVVPTGKILCYLKAPDGVLLELSQYIKKENLDA